MGTSEPGRTKLYRDPGFPATQWSEVLLAGNADSAGRAAALESLCRRYWFPIYSFLRREGHDIQDSQDLTQEFLARVIERNPLKSLQTGQGRFRSFLLVVLRYFLSDHRKRTGAQKRGGGQAVISIDAVTAEARHQLEAVEHETPESLFERRWAEVVYRRALDSLELNYSRRGQKCLFLRIRSCLTGEAEEYAGVARELGMTPGALKTAVNRLRQRFGWELRREVGATVSVESEIEAEMRQVIRLAMKISGNLPS